MAQPQPDALSELSELIDGELGAEQTEALIDALCRDQALAAEWHRMYRLRALLKGDELAGFDVRDAVRAALASEPTYLLPVAAPRPARRLARYALGGALAASVALLTVVGMRQWQAPAGSAPLAQAPPTQTATTVAARAEAADPSADASRLESYFAVYAENALFSGQDTPSLVRSVRAKQAR
jgi:negative regulator of sigma E activity